MHAPHSACPRRNSLIAALVLILAGWGPAAVAQLPPKRSTAFDGAQTARVAYPSAFYAPSNTLTLEAWVYREAENRCETVVSQNFTTSFWFGFCADRLRFYRQGGAPIDAARNVPARRWTHIAVVFNPNLPASSNSVAFYIDGVGAGVANPRPTTTPMNLPLYVGATPGGLLATYPFFGAIDEVRIWSVPRTVEQIRTNRFRELVAEPGLVAVVPGGENIELVSGRAAVQVTGATPQTGGVLPRDLVVPRVGSPIVFDGRAFDGAYAEAEVLMVRYPNGTNEFDVPARLVMAPSPTSLSEYLHVGIPNLPSDTSATVLSAKPWWRVYVDRQRGAAAAPQTNDMRFAYDAYGTGDIERATGTGTGTFAGAEAASNYFDAKTESGVEFDAPSVEFRFQPSAILPAPAGERRGFLMDIHDPFVAIFLPGFTRVSPFDANISDTGTWPEITLGATLGRTARAEFSIAVVNPDRTNAPLPGARVSLWNRADRTLIGQGTAGSRGTISFVSNVPTNVPLQLQLELPAEWRFADPPRIAAGTPAPLGTTVATVDFPGCRDARCTYPQVTFLALDPPADGATAVFAGLESRDADSALLLRESPLQLLPAGTATVLGSNFDRGIRAWTVLDSGGCTASPGSGDPDPRDNFPGCSWRLNEPIARSMTDIRFQLQYTNLVARTVRVWLYNSWNGRWMTVPGATLTLGEPAYPLVHGFAFENYRDGHDIDDYRVAFPGVVCDPFKMVGFWAFFPIYLDLFGEGECVGMVTSSHFLRGSVAPSSFVRGVQRAAGFVWDDNLSPTFDVGNPCAPRPTSLRAFIRGNHGVQASSQFLGETLAQLQFGFSGPLGGDIGPWGDGWGAGLFTPMGDRLRDIRAGPRSKIVCIKPDLLGSGHALLPLNVRTTALAHVHEIDVYDPNHPGETRVLRINTNANRFAYDGFAEPWHGAYVFVHDIPRFWTGGRDIISIDTLGVALDHFGARGLLELLGMLVSGDAEPLLRFPNGTSWGWRADRTPVNTATNLAEIPDFGRLLRPVDPLGHGPAQVFFNPRPALPTIDVHARGSRYHFQLSHAGHLFQVLAEERQAGDRDQVKLLAGVDFLRPGSSGSAAIAGADQLQGFQFLPGRAGARFTPRIALGRGGSNTLALFSWSGLPALAGGAGLRFGVDAVRHGALLVNDAAVPVEARLSILTPPASGTSPVTNEFVLPAIPPGAALGSYLLAVGPGQPARIQLELDRDRDRVPDAQWVVAPGETPGTGAPELRAESRDGRVVLRWPATADAWLLVAADRLEGPWVGVEISPVKEGNDLVVSIPVASPAQRFFQLKSAKAP